MDKIYTIDDLRKWTRTEPSLAVIGKPIAHSLSPKMHNAAIAELNGGQASSLSQMPINPTGTQALAGQDENCESPFFCQNAAINQTRRHLPHWEQQGKFIFATFRLEDSIPKEKLTQWKLARDTWKALHPQPWDESTESEYYEKFSNPIDKFLDDGHGACILKQKKIREIVEETLRYFDAERYDLLAFAIMPNHVHVLFKLLGENKIEEILHSWKSFSAHAINKKLSRTGTLWQSESWDRIIRSQKHFDRVVKYIEENPNSLPNGREISSLYLKSKAFARQAGSLSSVESLAYFKFEVAPENLEEALPLFYKHNFIGLNLTIPHKVIALPFLKTISPRAKIIGATNTLTRDTARGGYCGDNTDGEGFRRAVENTLNRSLAGTPIILLGAGGAARAIAATALENHCANLTILNRSREKAEALADELRAHFPNAKILCGDAQTVPAKNALIVNATSLGLKPDDASPFPPARLERDMVVFDTTYGTHVPALVAAAKERGVPASDGRSMLAWQGALAFEIWTSVPADVVFPIMGKTILE